MGAGRKARGSPPTGVGGSPHDHRVRRRELRPEPLDETDRTPRIEETEEGRRCEREILACLLASDSGGFSVQRSPHRGLVYWTSRDPAQKEGLDMWPSPFHTPLSPGACGYARAAARPADLPADLPFLVDCPLVVNPQGSKVTLHWLHVAAGLAALREVVARCEASGWRRRDRGEIAAITGCLPASSWSAATGRGSRCCALLGRRAPTERWTSSRVTLSRIRVAPATPAALRVSSRRVSPARALRPESAVRVSADGGVRLTGLGRREAPCGAVR